MVRQTLHRQTLSLARSTKHKPAASSSIAEEIDEEINAERNVSNMWGYSIVQHPQRSAAQTSMWHKLLAV